MKQSFLFFVCPPPPSDHRASALLWTVDVESDENLRDGKLLEKFLYASLPSVWLWELNPACKLLFNSTKV